MAIIFIVLIVMFSGGLIYQTGSPHQMSNRIHAIGYNTSLFPDSMDSYAWINLLVLFGIQWWSALFCDMPNMEGQKLLNAGKNKGTIQFLKGVFLFVLIEVFLMLIPLYALGLHSTKKFSSGEELIAFFFNNLHGYIWFAGIGILSISFISVGANFQIWSAGMIESRMQELSMKNIPIKFNSKIWMIIITWISIFLAYQHQTFLSIVEYLFLISVGVGPVYILRWFWKRINAWSQLSAMIASPVYLFFYHFTNSNSKTIHLFFEELKTKWMLNTYSFEMILLSCLVIPTWVIVTFLTAPVQSNTTNLFFKTVRNQIVSIHQKDIIVWIITCMGFLFVKTGWWNLLTGNLLTGIFQLAFVFLIFIVLRNHFKQKKRKHIEIY